MAHNPPAEELQFTPSRGGSGKATIAYTTPPAKEKESPQADTYSTEHIGETIAITAGRGGSGKTTVSLLLGAAIAKKNLKVCLVEFDEDNSINNLLGKKSPNARQLEELGSYSPENIHAHLIHDKNFNMDILLGTATDKSFYEKVIPVLKTMFDIIIFDTAYISNTNTGLTAETALPLADKIAVVARKDINGINALREVMNRHIAGMGVPNLIIFNGNNNFGKEYTWALDELKADIAGTIPLSTSIIHNAYSQQRLHTVLDNKHIGAIYQEIADKVLNLSKTEEK